MSDLVVSEKETRIAKAIKALTPRELDAYKYFVRTKQTQIADKTADEMYALYAQGTSCDEIRKLLVGFSLGQIVGARVIFGWDERLAGERAALVTEVPARASQTQLQNVDFLGKLLTATHKQWSDKLQRYIASGDESLLVGLPMPKNIKDLSALVELFLKSTGQDKKRVEVTGTVLHEHKGPVSAAEARNILKELDDDVIDVEATPVTEKL
jgi:hypothetical protein